MKKKSSLYRLFQRILTLLFFALIAYGAWSIYTLSTKVKAEDPIPKDGVYLIVENDGESVKLAAWDEDTKRYGKDQSFKISDLKEGLTGEPIPVQDLLERRYLVALTLNDNFRTYLIQSNGLKAIKRFNESRPSP